MAFSMSPMTDSLSELFLVASSVRVSRLETTTILLLLDSNLF